MMGNLLSAVRDLSNELDSHYSLFKSTTAIGTYHQYPSDGYISVHPDPKRFVNFICMLCTDGVATINAGPSPDDMPYCFNVGPNSVVFLRAPLPNDETDYRPYHQVTVTQAPRRSIVLRQKLNS